MRVGLVVNPTSGSGRGGSHGARFRAAATAAGHEVVELGASTYAAAREHARSAVRANEIDVLAVCGGDGMVHLGVGVCALTEVPLLIVAAGTGNDNARELGLPLAEPEKAAALLDHGRATRVDAGRVDSAAGTGEPVWFLGVLGAGFDSVVTERVAHWRRVPGPVRYPLAVIRELATFRPIPYVITVDDTRVETSAMLVAVGNGPAFGGGMRVCPEARMDDGLLDVVVLHKVSRLTFLRVFPLVYAGRHTSHPRVQQLRGRTVTLEAAGILAQGDGERVGPLPLTCTAVPNALTVLLPAAAPG